MDIEHKLRGVQELIKSLALISFEVGMEEEEQIHVVI